MLLEALAELLDDGRLHDVEAVLEPRLHLPHGARVAAALADLEEARRGLGEPGALAGRREARDARRRRAEGVVVVVLSFELMSSMENIAATSPMT